MKIELRKRDQHYHKVPSFGTTHPMTDYYTLPFSLFLHHKSRMLTIKPAAPLVDTSEKGVLDIEVDENKTFQRADELPKGHPTSHVILHYKGWCTQGHAAAIIYALTKNDSRKWKDPQSL